MGESYTRHLPSSGTKVRSAFGVFEFIAVLSMIQKWKHYQKVVGVRLADVMIWKSMFPLH